MNILLVEDEPPILRELEHYIKKFGEPYHILATATDGNRAREIIDEYQDKIDFLLTDIQIPIINGLELVEYVRKRYPSIICTVLTGYSDFAYVQKALRLKILDYILKPIEEEILQKQLKDAYEQKCLDSAKSELITGYTAAPASSGELSLNYRQVLINIGQFSNKTDLSHDGTVSSGNAKMLEEILRRFRTRFMKYWMIRAKNCYSYFVLFSFNSRQAGQRYSLYHELYQALTRHFPVITFVSSDTPVILHNINKNMQELSKCIYKNILFAKSSYIQAGEEALFQDTPGQSEGSAATHSIMQLSKLFINGSRDLFLSELFQFLQPLRLHSIRQNTMGVYLLTLLTECTLPYLHHAPIQQMEPYKIIEDILMLSTSYESLYTNLVSIFDDILATIANETGSTRGKSTTFLQINDYIKKHYADAINTKTIADHFGFTPAYLSKLFREYKEITPSEYISRLRISKAKELLHNNSSISVREIAAAIGYDDPLYFSKVFKKLVGVTPKAYQLDQGLRHK